MPLGFHVQISGMTILPTQLPKLATHISLCSILHSYIHPSARSFQLCFFYTFTKVSYLFIPCIGPLVQPLSFAWAAAVD